jgi:alpha-tubulin suppressor-like RCC1 family protein
MSFGVTWLAALLTMGIACTQSAEVLHPGGEGTGGSAGSGSGGTGNGPVVLQVSEVRLATGQTHACRVVSGALSCWGEDDDGRLGVSPSSAPGQGPVSVAGGNWLVPAAGERHSCALSADGEVSCWGANDLGQLGSGDRTASVAPRVVALPTAAIDVRTSFNHSCAVLSDASLWCWGDNLEGQLGLADRYPGDARLSPVQVGSDKDWVFVAPGQGHTCGIRSPGALYCWGRNTDAQIGQGASEPQQYRAPTRVGSDSDWVEVAAGQGTSCARKRDKTLYCWGSSGSGLLSLGDLEPHPTPTRVPNFDDWSGLASATFHTCGLRAGGEIWCAGRNTEGQIGASELSDAMPDMQRTDPNPNWVEVRTGRFFTCARKADSSVWCLGVNREREFGADVTLDHSNVMQKIP